MLRLFREVEQVGHARLHAEGHLVLGDAGLDLRVAQDAVTLIIERRDLVELFAADFARDALGVLQVEDAFALIAELNPLELGGEEACAPKAVVQRLVGRTAAAKRGHHHVSGQVGVLAAEAVSGPRADARAAGKLAARLHEGDGRVMVDRLRMHPADDAPFVRLGGDMRDQFAEPVARLAVLLELEDRRSDGEILLARRHRRQALALADRFRQVLAAHGHQLRLRIEEVHLGRGAGLEEVDDALRLRFEVREA